MKILPVIQNFLPKYGMRTISFGNNSHFGISFSGQITPLLDEDTVDFKHTPMSGREFKKYGRYMTDLYTGKKMLTSQQLLKMKNRRFFQGPISSVVKKLKPYAKDYLDGTELEVFKQIQEAAKRDPDFTLPQLFNFWYNDTRDHFRKEQKPYFDKIKKLGTKLPAGYIEPFSELMEVTDKKLYDTPIIQKFSLKEFTYNVNKLTDKIADLSLKNRINSLMAMLHDETMTDDSLSVSPFVIKKSFNFINKKVPMKKNLYYEKYMKHYEWDKDAVRVQIIENMMDAANLKGYKRLGRLCANNIDMIKCKPVKIPFSNKAFRYDLNKILADLPDEKLKNEILTVARELPSSSDSAEALILKYKDSDANTIGDRLFNPSLVSIEHLVPQCEGGSDLMTNCALARRKNNYERMDEPLCETLKYYDIKNQQKYVDRLVKLVNRGLIDYDDAVGQIQTIEKEGNIKLDYEKKIKKRKYTIKDEQMIQIKKKYANRKS